MNDIINEMKKSVKSLNPCKSVIQTSYNIVKAHGGELKEETIASGETENKDSGTNFIIILPY